ncbi:MAG TPA: hypothetical protein VIJ57_09415, partial [Hanamia sp.]
MQKEKFLNNLIFDTGLFDITKLSGKENITIRRYLQDQKTPDEIAKENELPVREVKKIIKTGIEKMSLTSKELFAKKMWFQKIV